MQVVRPTRFHAWVFVAACGLSSTVSSSATALFMTPDPVVVYVEAAPEEPKESCHGMRIHSVIPRSFAQEWFSALDASGASGAREARDASDGKFEPIVQDRELVGMKLHAIRSQSFYDRIGLMNGDTIVSVEGVEIARLRDERLRQRLFDEDFESIPIDIIRQGCPASVDVGLI